MKKNLSQSLNKIPIIIIAIDINKQITFYNNVAKQKFLFIEEKIDINNLDVINILRNNNHKTEQLVRIYEIVIQEIKKKYNLEKYEQLKNFLFPCQDVLICSITIQKIFFQELNWHIFLVLI